MKKPRFINDKRSILTLRCCIVGFLVLGQVSACKSDPEPIDDFDDAMRVEADAIIAKLPKPMGPAGDRVRGRYPMVLYSSTGLPPADAERLLRVVDHALTSNSAEAREVSARVVLRAGLPAAGPLAGRLSPERKRRAGSFDPVVALRAVDLLARLGDRGVFGLYNYGLQSSHPQVKTAAAAALERITGEDFGQDVVAWSKWRKENPLEPKWNPPEKYLPVTVLNRDLPAGTVLDWDHLARMPRPESLLPADLIPKDMVNKWIGRKFKTAVKTNDMLRKSLLEPVAAK